MHAREFLYLHVRASASERSRQTRGRNDASPLDTLSRTRTTHTRARVRKSGEYAPRGTAVCISRALIRRQVCTSAFLGRIAVIELAHAARLSPVVALALLLEGEFTTGRDASTAYTALAHLNTHDRSLYALSAFASSYPRFLCSRIRRLVVRCRKNVADVSRLSNPRRVKTFGEWTAATLPRGSFNISTVDKQIYSS